jgi:REP element-mobilizing transposase RayT
VPLPDTPQIEQFGKPTVNSIPTIIELFKSTVTKQINELRGTPGKPVWQRNYFERVIRDEDELNRIREYIIYNPVKWVLDEDNPLNWK